MKNIDKIKKENEKLKNQIYKLQIQVSALEETLNRIKSAKTFIFWQFFRNSTYRKNIIDRIKRLIDFLFKGDYLTISYKLNITFKKNIIKIPKINLVENNKKNKCKVDVIIPWYGDLRVIPLIEKILNEKSDYLNSIILINDAYPKKEISEKLETFIKKTNSKKIKYYVNKKNLGFVKTCNKGIEITKNDFILLNSDTLISKNWLEKIVKAAYSDDKIASVTPLSNNATIFSFPLFNQINDYQNPDFISNTLEKITPVDYIEVPTMHGYCCFIKKKYIDKYGKLDTIFGRGYGEENDLSLRFKKNGLKNIGLLNTYINHFETKSFTTKEKIKLINDHMKIIIKRYPNYLNDVFNFIREKPFYFLTQLYFFFIKNKKIFNDNFNLIILHSNPFETIGGVEHETLKMIKKFSKKNTILFYFDKEKRQFEFVIIVKNKILKIIEINESIENSYKILSYILKIFKINNIFIEHLLNHNLNETLKLIKKIKNVKKFLFIHDYYYIHGSPQPFYKSKKFKILFDNTYKNNNLKEFFCIFDNIIFSSDFLKNIYLNKIDVKNINDLNKKFLIYYPL